MEKNTNDENRSEINILLLGETGVGKSTFINAFLNYLHYDSFADAELGELKYLVPSSFEVFGKKIKIGSDSNECSIPGQSSTQDPKTHVFYFDPNSLLRIIDTPGINDTRGVDKDKINLEYILRCISKLQIFKRNLYFA